MRILSCLLALLLAGVCPLWGQSRPKARPKPKSELSEKIKAYLWRTNRSALVTAVASVRGGAPAKQTADLEKTLATRAAGLRRALLAAPDPGGEKSLRKVYRALAVSHLVRSAELGASGGVGFGFGNIGGLGAELLRHWSGTGEAVIHGD